MRLQVHSAAPLHARACRVCTEAVGHVGQGALPTVRMPEFPSQPHGPIPPLSCVPSPPCPSLWWFGLRSACHRVSAKPRAHLPRTKAPKYIHMWDWLLVFPCCLRACTDVTRDSLHLWGFREKKGSKRCPISASSASTACSKQSEVDYHPSYLLEKVRFEALRIKVELIFLPFWDRNANSFILWCH